MSKKSLRGGVAAWWLFFCTIIDVLKVFFISFLKNQRIGVTGRSPCRLFPALSTLPANVKKPDGLLPISWGN
ncbi:TPA: hypothetical protein ACMEWK_003262 [Klebsiella variicola subsp. variicola]|uniref:hypothetical protein n=1 Tax=Klebsiella variicola TaxID=244366 RepID=UPI00254A1192|nr:hypothetical protein [Klebsiella variicola]MEC5670965.1 hypothetical protein [Klebsiella variicola]